MRASSVDGKVVVITGASSGLGESTARLLGQNGAKLVLGARRIDRLKRLASEISSSGGPAIAVTTDVTRRSDMDALVRTAVEQFARLEVLVNNAGIGPYAPLEQVKVDEWERMIDAATKNASNTRFAGRLRHSRRAIADSPSRRDLAIVDCADRSHQH